ncbi:MAG: filamentous hemagglutinin N-terminal domain-containing protein [Phormidesmis sp.]
MRHIRWKSTLTTVLAGMLLSSAGSVSAQLMPIPDDTLGEESSTLSPIAPDYPGDVVEGGSRIGNSLLHSFETFHVEAGRAIYFADPGVDSILSRVTGDTESQIFGLLGVFGDADLFIINPNGIIFGENVRLNLQGGSFLATTADAIELEMSETGSPTAPMLTVRPSAFLFNQTNPAAITNNARTLPPVGLDSAPGGGLRVVDGEGITLLGGDINVENGGISALGGRIELGGLSEPGRVVLNADSSLEFPEDVARSNVWVANGSRVSASDFTISGGSVTVTANELDIINDSRLSAGTVGEAEFVAGQAGDITLSANRIRLVNAVLDNIVRASRSDGGDVLLLSDELSISDRSIVQSTLLGEGRAGKVRIETRDRTTIDGSLISSGLGGGDRTLIAAGSAGNIEIETSSLLLTNQARLQANTIGKGNAGNVIIDASQSVAIESESRIFSDVSTNFAGNPAVGDGGDIQITTPVLSLTDEAALSSRTDGQGNGGDIQIVADSLSLTGQSRLSTDSSGRGDAGNVTLEIQDLAIFDRSYIFSNMSPLSENAAQPANTDDIRSAGSIQIAAGSLDMKNGAQFQSTTDGRGDAGNVTIQAQDRISIEGVDPDIPSIATTIFAITREGAQGRGGNVNMTADLIRLIDNGLVSTTTDNRFAGGSVTAQANTLELIGGGRILTRTGGDGRAGDINLDITDSTILSGDNTFKIGDDPSFFSGLFASTTRPSAGSGGTVRLSTSDLRVLDQARIEVDSQGSGTAGNMAIAADTVRLDNGRLTAETAAVNGGNIVLEGLDLLLLRNGSLISTTAGTDGTGGNGGNIDIQAAAVVSVPDENSDILANAFSGSGGNVRINTSGLFGITAQSQDNPLANDITASSELGTPGTVDIATPDTDPSRGLTELPATFADASNQITQTCAGNGDGQSSEFVVTGRGGLPSNPTDALVGDVPLSDWAVLEAPTETAHSSVLPEPAASTLATSTQENIVEAQGWIRENGSVRLVAETLAAAAQAAVPCQ